MTAAAAREHDLIFLPGPLLGGVFIGRLADINEVGGYDERIRGYG